MTGGLPRAAAAGLLALLAACNAPDYTPVRDWARTASLVADYPLVIAPQPARPGTLDGALAMQEALATYLAGLGRMAEDGVLPYMEDPFVDLAARARHADPAGGDAVATIGRTLRLATRQNWAAPELRDTIVAFDPAVQALVAALAGTVAPAPVSPAPPDPAPAPAPRDRAGREAAREAAQARARDAAAAAALAAARAQYASLVRQIGQGHALLKDSASRITTEEVVQRIAAEQDRLRRAALALPRPVVAVPAAP